MLILAICFEISRTESVSTKSPLSRVPIGDVSSCCLVSSMGEVPLTRKVCWHGKERGTMRATLAWRRALRLRTALFCLCFLILPPRGGDVAWRHWEKNGAYRSETLMPISRLCPNLPSCPKATTPPYVHTFRFRLEDMHSSHHLCLVFRPIVGCGGSHLFLPEHIATSQKNYRAPKTGLKGRF